MKRQILMTVKECLPDLYLNVAGEPSGGNHSTSEKQMTMLLNVAPHFRTTVKKTLRSINLFGFN